MSIQLAVFDLAGTTVTDENFVGKAFQKAFHDFDFEIETDDINQLIGYKKTYAIEIMLKKIAVEYD